MDKLQMKQVQRQDAQQRYQYLLDEVTSHGELWILTDQHGCMMLTTEEEDCIPIWPHREFAQCWITGEWQNCQATPISLARWHSHWTPGMVEDSLSVVVFPNPDEEGFVLSPEELDEAFFRNEKKKSLSR